MPTPGPPLGARHPGQQRPHVRRRPPPRRPTSCSWTSRTPARPREGVGPRQRRHGAHRPRLGTHGAGDPHQRPRHPWCHDDIIEVVTGARDNVDTIIIPKVRRARDVWWVDVLLTQLEAKLGLEPADPPRGAHRGGRGPGQRRGDRRSQRPAGRADLRRRRFLAVAGRAGGHQLRPARRIPRRLLGLRPRHR